MPPPLPDVVARVVAAARQRLGDDYRATYLWGSHARGDPIETSDVDVGVFVRRGFARDAADAIEREIEDALGDPRLDFAVVRTEDLDGRDAVSFRHGSLRVDGEDLRDAVPLPSRGEWTDLSDEAALWWVSRRREGAVVRPLPPIDAADEFLGYVCRKVVVAEGRQLPSTKEALGIAGRVATACVARASGRFVGDRPQAIRAHREDVGGAWADFLEELEETLRTRWRYLVPDGAKDRATLRRLCARTLEFERAFVERVAAGPRGPRTETAWRAATRAVADPGRAEGGRTAAGAQEGGASACDGADAVVVGGGGEGDADVGRGRGDIGDVAVRPYAAPDLEGVVGLWHRAKRAAYPYLPAEQSRTLDEDRDFFLKSIVPRSRIWVAAEGGDVRGFLALQDGGYVDRLYVDPQHQRRGCGRRLLDEAARARSGPLRLHTHQQNLAARAFYERLGFRAVSFGLSPAPESMPDVEYLRDAADASVPAAAAPERAAATAAATAPPAPPAAAVPLDAALVRRLLTAQFPEWAALPLRPVEPGGWDHRTFRLGDELSVRLPSADRYAAQVEKEALWLPRLAPLLPLPIPEPLATGAPGDGFPRPWSVRRWIEGDVATLGRIDDLDGFAGALAAFLAALHRIDVAGAPGPGPHNFFRGGPPATYDAETRRAIASLGGEIDVTAAMRVWEDALAALWCGPSVWVHGDVHATNLLVRDGRLSAVLDFGSCGAGDPACDLTIAWTFLPPGPRATFRAALRPDEATWARARGWALWKALLTLAGQGGADPARAPDARATLAALFAV